MREMAMSQRAAAHEAKKEEVRREEDRWRREEPAWFRVDKIGDEFLPSDVFEAVGGAGRRRSIMSVRVFVGLEEE